MTTLTDRCDEAMADAVLADLLDRSGIKNMLEEIRQDKETWSDLRTEIASAALAALLSELDAAGWQIVPKTATAEMIAAVRRLDWKSQSDIDWPDGYAAMLAAAPEPFKLEDKP